MGKEPYNRKEKSSQINYLSIYPKKLEKEQQSNQKKGNSKVKLGINELEKARKFMNSKGGSFRSKLTNLWQD